MSKPAGVRSSGHPPDLAAFLAKHGRLPRLGEDPPPWRYRGWLLPYVIELHQLCPAVGDRWGYNVMFTTPAEQWASSQLLAGQFVQGLRDNAFDPAKKRIVATLIRLAHGLGLTATAEGVETTEAQASASMSGVSALTARLTSSPLKPPSFPSAFSNRLSLPSRSARSR